jgi:hypothetical protein
VAETEENEAVLFLRMVRIIDEECVLVKENRPGFCKRNAMLLQI